MAVNPFPDLPFANASQGLRTETGVLVPFGSRVVYLCSLGMQDGDDPNLSGRLCTTLAQALAACRASRGDTIIALPGHSESVTSATALSAMVAGTRIIGVGLGATMTTFRFTATAAQWAISAASVFISGLRLRLEGAAIVKAINITGADVTITNCDIEVGSATSAAVIALEIGTSADRCQILNNRFRGTVAGAVTDCVLVAGVSSGVRIVGNEIMCSTGAVSTGCIRVGAVAALSVVIADNWIRNTLASSETGIGTGDAASTGIIARNFISTEAGTPVSDGIELHTNSLFRCFQNFVSDTKNTSGLLGPAVVT